MKTKIIKLTHLLFISSLFLLSCEDNENLVETIDNKNPKVKEVTLIDLSNDKNFIEAFSKINKNSQLNNNLLGRTVMEDQYNFTIDDYPVKVIELDSLTSYTFSINNETRTNSVFENLVVNHYINGVTKAAIFKYIPDNNNPSNNSLVDEHNSISFVGTTEITPIVYNDNDVLQRQTSVCFTSVALLCNYGGRTHPAGERCGTTYWGTQTNCETIFSFPDFYTSIVQIIEDYNNENPGLGAGGGISEVLSNILSPEELTWWNHATQEEKQPILDYLNPNINDGESWLFVKEAINNIKNGGEVDFENATISDSIFKDSQLDCIHKQLKQIPNDLYSKMLAEFNGNTSSTLTFKIGATPTSDWGITKGSANLPNNYTITISPSIENGSNLMKTVTLCHELIHAYMLNTLEKANYLIYDNDGNPLFNSNLCNTSTNYQNVDLNTLNTADRLFVLLCGMNQVNPLTPQWSHSIFNTATFDIVTYRQALENFIFSNHDWDNENPAFKTRAMNVFGANWKRKVAQATSWIGLEQTAGYQNYKNLHQPNFQQYQYITVFKSIEILNAKSTCL